jgi:hypothetical protein
MKIKFNIKIDEVKSTYQEQIDKLNKELVNIKHHYEEIIQNNKKLLSDGNLNKQREIDDMRKHYEDHIKTLTHQYEEQFLKLKVEWEKKMNTALEDLIKMYENKLIETQKAEEEKVKLFLIV